MSAFFVKSQHFIAKTVPLMWEFLKAPFLVLHFSYDVIYNIGIHADGTTLYSKFIQASDLWQQLESASESESDL